ncbi:MAG: GGDEF domain-containing protein [Lachnospiraceae bacterium]
MGKHTFGEQILQGILMLILLILVARSANLSGQIQGTSRVINYAGIVRGCTQRVVKRELSGKTSDDLISYLDEILSELQGSEGTYHLSALPDEAYQEQLAEQQKEWTSIKQQIARVRENSDSSARSGLFDASESYYDLCDDTVSLAEEYSEKLLRLSGILAWCIILDLALQTVIIFHRTYLATRVYHRNALMEQKTYIDSLTGVYNRRYYDELLHELGQGEDYSVIFIDLDHLKLVNDTYGHDAGDQYIQRSVSLIRAQFRTTDMMFRFGGDEFLLFLKGCTEDIASHLIGKAYAAVERDKTLGHDCSFSYGIYSVKAQDGISLKTAVTEADRKMYQFKKAHGDIRKV